MDESTNNKNENTANINEPVEVKLRRTELVLLILLFFVVITWLIYMNGKIIYDNGIH